jgi:phosphoribosylamine---glycine ligase
LLLLRHAPRRPPDSNQARRSRRRSGVADPGQPIHGIDDRKRTAQVFHAGTAWRDGTLTAGGRALIVGVTVGARGASVEEASARAYQGVAKIHFEGMQYRRDIGRKALSHAN